LAPRQIWLFRLGCWVAFATAALHLAEHVSGINALPPMAVAHADASPPSYVWLVPGLHQPTFLGVVNGFSLSLSLLVATIGAAGLVVVKYGAENAPLLRGVSRAYALGTGVLLAVSVVQYFSVQTFAMAVMALCFALAAVSYEG
jgi:hypothetical protein